MKHDFQRDRIAMAPPPTVDAAMTAAKTKYATAKMEHALAKLGLERAQL